MRLTNFAVVSLILLIVGGVVVVVVSRARHAAQQELCQGHLKLIGMAAQNYQATFNHFPAGTVANADLPADRRLSWLSRLYPNFTLGGLMSGLDEAKPWDAAENCPPLCKVRTDVGPRERWEVRPMGEMKWLVCPASGNRNGPELPSMSSYVGIAGVGEDAAELPLSDRRAGFFGYDRKITRKDIKDGESNTLLAAEVADGGPWTAGGRATVRGLAPGRPYPGEGGQFPGPHRAVESSSLWPPRVTNVGFADGHARGLTDAVSASVLEGLATVAGGEDVGQW
jgi:prepilin-type processing-associated H-X9-DG protein